MKVYRSNKTMKKSILMIIVIPLFLIANTYTVEKGDTLSEIAQDNIGKPVFGNQGTLNQLLDMNPDVDPKKYIYPGQKIKLNQENSIPIQTESTPPPAQPSADPTTSDPPWDDSASESQQTKFVLYLHGHLDNLHFGSEARPGSL